VSVAEASPESERAGLSEFLGYKREALIGTLQGLSDEQARLTPTASSLSLLSLVKHSAIWERRWFQVIVAGRRFPGEWPEMRSDDGDRDRDRDRDREDATFRLDDEDTVETVVADYREQIVASNEILDTFDLDSPCAWPGMAQQNLRWVALHMLEETAHHVGHADIIRESIDGRR
jgi:hypothetical protein